jgi:hypothetical protein
MAKKKIERILRDSMGSAVIGDCAPGSAPDANKLCMTFVDFEV